MKYINHPLNYLLFVFLFTHNLSAQQLKVIGGYLKMNNSKLVLQDMNLVNNGTIASNNASVNFTGTMFNTIVGDNNLTFDTLVINKTSGRVSLEQSIIVNSHLELTAGLLDLQDSDIDLIADATIGTASSSTYVQTSGMGTLVQQVANSDVIFPIGNSSYNPAILNNNGGTSDFYAVRVRDELLEDGIIGDAVTSYAVNRTWEINEQTASGSNLDITLMWDDSDEVGTTGSDYMQANFNGGWSMVSEGAAGNTLDLISLSSVNNSNLGDFAIFEDRSPLTDSYICNENGNLAITGRISNLSNYHAQINLTSDAVIEAGANILCTASTDVLLSEGFTVENGATFHAFIASCSFNSLQSLTERNSNPEIPSIMVPEPLQIEVFPNPFSHSTNIKFYLEEAGPIQFLVSDLSGRILHSETMDVASGWQQTKFEPGNLSSGTFFLFARSNSQQKVKQLFVQQ